MTGEWYKGGLKFGCTQCGNCCTGAPGYVWVTREEIVGLARFLGIPPGDLSRRYVRKAGSRYSLIEKPNGDCIFYSKGCTVYPARPVQCRSFPFWPENLKSQTAWNEMAAECPGTGSGRLYQVENITRIRTGEADAWTG